ncbi:MAG: D-glycerate dehydrogenase [Pseudomonadota bacterium]
MSSKPKVIVTRRLAPAVEERMAELFDVEINADDSAMDSEALARAMRECDVLVPTVTDDIATSLFEQDGIRTKLIANFGAGVDHIDLKAARTANIIVTNTPGVFTDDTADMTMALILGVPRRLSEGSKLLRSGKWRGWSPSAMLGHRIGGKTLGIIGMGRIGQAVAHRARAFGLNIRYHNRRRLPESLEQMLGASYELDLDTLIAASDIITLHCPHSEETHEMINAERIASMRPDAYLINTARGELIDEEALIEALENDRIGGAGLDVYTHEPAINPRLLEVDNTVLMPHMGSATFEGREASGMRVAANIRIWSDGHRPPDQVLEGWA